MKRSHSPPNVASRYMSSPSPRFSPLVLMPPTCRVCSSNTTEAPSRAAAMAAVTPPGVAP